MESRRAGQRREREELRRKLAPAEEAVQAALGLIALAGEHLGWPLPEDPVSLREEQLVYERWARLRGGHHR